MLAYMMKIYFMYYNNITYNALTVYSSSLFQNTGSVSNNQ